MAAEPVALSDKWGALGAAVAGWRRGRLVENAAGNGGDAGGDGGGLSLFPSNANVTDCRFEGNRAGDGGDAAGGRSAGDGGFDAGSPAIEAGNPAAAIPPSANDIDGQLRVWNGRVDMGADEFGSAMVGDMNCDGALNAFDIEGFILALVDPGGVSRPLCGLPHRFGGH